SPAMVSGISGVSGSEAAGCPEEDAGGVELAAGWVVYPAARQQGQRHCKYKSQCAEFGCRD
ncbi:MAG: hypothetical protein V8S86_12110, partial [Eubacteriales bacterium]